MCRQFSRKEQKTRVWLHNLQNRSFYEMDYNLISNLLLIIVGRVKITELWSFGKNYVFKKVMSEKSK